MTLRDKFLQLFKGKMRVSRSIECEKIADNYAVEFGEYLDSLTTDDMGSKSIKQLLEIFKKEKEL